MVASKKQIQEHNNLPIFLESKNPRKPWALQEHVGCPRTQMQTLTIMDKGVVENFYHITNMGECELNETNTFILKTKFQTLGPLFFIYLHFKRKKAFQNVRTLENQYFSLIHSMYANAANNTPSCNYITLYVVWRVHLHKCDITVVKVHIVLRFGHYSSIDNEHT